MTAEPNDGQRARALAEVEHDYPGWHAWPGGAGGLVYARRPQPARPWWCGRSPRTRLRQEIEAAEQERGLR